MYISSVQLFSHVLLFATPWTAAHQASLSNTNSWSILKFTSIKSVMPSNHLILCRPPSPPAFHLSQHQSLFQWVSCLHQVVKYWSFSFNISPSNEYSGLISFRMDWLDLLTIQGALKSLLQQIQNSNSFKSINSLALSLLYGPTLTLIYDYWENNSFHCKELGRQIDHSVL